VKKIGLAILIVIAATFFGTLAGKHYTTGNSRSDPNPALSSLAQNQPEMDTRWASFENPLAQKGAGATTNQGFKGHPFDSLEAGETKTLMHVDGSGEIRRMWFTLMERDPQMLRSLRLQIFWDSASTAAVDVPFGDFFADILGHTTAFENALFANPEGRSFVSYIPMPFRTGASVKLTNESPRKIGYLFYDVDFIETKHWNPNSLYFHAIWRREQPTTLGRDFEILPKVEGEGRFLGAHVGVIANQQNVGWWGEGVAKLYLDGDTSQPTMVGTGTEDYIGTGWGQEVFFGRFAGCTLSDRKAHQFGFYRYHIPDPIYFHRDIRVTLSQIGGATRSEVLEMMKKGLPVKPVTMDNGGQWLRLLDSPGQAIQDIKTKPTDPFTAYARQDDLSAVAFFYLNSPENHLPALAPVAARIHGLSAEKEK
jgi:hypothetical protein